MSFYQTIRNLETKQDTYQCQCSMQDKTQNTLTNHDKSTHYNVYLQFTTHDASKRALFLHFSPFCTHTHIYIYIYVCVCTIYSIALSYVQMTQGTPAWLLQDHLAFFWATKFQDNLLWSGQPQKGQQSGPATTEISWGLEIIGNIQAIQFENN